MRLRRFAVPFAAVLVAACAASAPRAPADAPTAPAPTPAPAPAAAASALGAFSVSLAVKDLAASRAFYEQLGFTAAGGDGARWQMLRQGDVVIGLFQGMFERNTLTFNPGWTQQATPLAHGFRDVRELQAQLQARGLQPVPAADPASTGPAYFVVTDPDGNPVLFDQHVGKPAAK
jgi:catechol 2,3-dioxygenase-like lactoylglutathione lyase family enzyme